MAKRKPKSLRRIEPKRANPVNPRKKLDPSKFLGTIKFEEDPLKIQKRLRDEWK